MEWSGPGILLASRPHGEHAALLQVLTPDHGRHAGVLRGGQGRRAAPMLQPGNLLALSWRARLADHMGSFTAELERDRAALLMANRTALSGLSSVCGLLCFALPERLALPHLYERTAQLLDVMGLTEAWPLLYLRWELELLDSLGFGLDLSACAVTGATSELIYVSPKSGRAVSRQGAGEWADRLLALPPCLLDGDAAEDAQIAVALGTTGYFLRKHVVPQWDGQPFPASRERLIDLLARSDHSAAR